MSGGVTAARPGATTRARVIARVAAPVLVLALAALAGCGKPAAIVSSIKLVNAFVMQSGGSGSGSGDAYLVISNQGAADELLSARSSAGGHVTLMAPSGPGGASIRATRSVLVPGHANLRMNPAGLRLVISNARPMRTGKDITLTLIFAHAGAITVQAQVTNAQTGGSSYFGP